MAAGMSTKVDIEIFAVAVGVSGESGIGSIGHHVEIVGETDIIYLPVTADILFYNLHLLYIINLYSFLSSFKKQNNNP